MTSNDNMKDTLENLEKAYNSGKIMCGRSAGANCWFQKCNSNSLKIEKEIEIAK